MSFLSREKADVRCGVIVDIGSGSVGVAIVVSTQTTNDLTVVWSHREHMLIKETSPNADIVRGINTATLNALLELGNGGLKALYAYNKDLRIRSIQTTLSAPWSFTATKTIHYEDEVPFLVSESLIEQLVTSAEKETTTSLTSQADEIRIIASATVAIELNGYSVKEPVGKKCMQVDIAHITVAAEEKILTAVEDSYHKILPQVPFLHYSFMYLYYQVVRNLHPDTQDVCLIDITNEATEMGIVRDDVLKNTAHIPVGLYSLAREIAKVCDLPKEEAYAIVKSGIDIHAQYTEKVCTQLEGIFLAYQDTLLPLFTKTVDTLEVPHTIFLHTTKDTETFFIEQLQKTVEKAGIKELTILLCTSELVGNKEMEDTALALSTYYFHTQTN